MFTNSKNSIITLPNSKVGDGGSSKFSNMNKINSFSVLLRRMAPYFGKTYAAICSIAVKPLIVFSN